MGLSNYLKNLCFNKNKNEIIIQDDNKELPDVRKIPIPDLKQYLIKGYEEIREVKQEKEQLQNELENAKKYEQLYEASLVTTDEFQKRDEENKTKIVELNNKINELRNIVADKDEIINSYKIQEKELNEKEEKINNIIHIKEGVAVDTYKEMLIDKITNLRGNISKSRLIVLIQEGGLDE